jgi:hypothetical protein
VCVCVCVCVCVQWCYHERVRIKRLAWNDGRRDGEGGASRREPEVRFCAKVAAEATAGGAGPTEVLSLCCADYTQKLGTEFGCEARGGWSIGRSVGRLTKGES